MLLRISRATEAIKATRSMAMLKHPAGTNHFQFRCHQPGFGAAVTGAGGASTLSCNSFTGPLAILLLKEKAVPAAFKRLDGSCCGGAAWGHENPNWLPLPGCSCVGIAGNRLRHHSLGSGGAGRHMDQRAWHCVDYQRRWLVPRCWQ